ncbi:hypothetical protein Zmor_005182 [Zophobas morio]|uniref:Uncharacterized protein n=1 Tax=Zophobas morio TaxID=2755281 RepID=A0AA38IVG6_9CUCU|nr:hypothetical protein Zmor_005182 [Zophobas morio]
MIIPRKKIPRTDILQKRTPKMKSRKTEFREWQSRGKKILEKGNFDKEKPAKNVEKGCPRRTPKKGYPRERRYREQWSRMIEDLERSPRKRSQEGKTQEEDV